MRWLAALALAALAAAPATAGPEPDTLVRAMRDELERSSRQLSLPGMARPYFIAYTISEQEGFTISASHGAVVSNPSDRSRYLRIDLRVGDPSFDNSNFGSDSSALRHANLPLDDDYEAIRHELWLATDRSYKNALSTLERKRAEIEGMAAADQQPDFTLEPPVRWVDTRKPAALPDQAHYAHLAATLSAVFREFPEIASDDVAIEAGRERSVFAASDGSLADQSDTFISVEIACRTQAEDGMTVKNFASFFATTAAQLPDETALVAEARRIARELLAIRSAPVLDDYSGPVLFEGRAAAQFVRGLLIGQLSGTPAPKSRRAEVERVFASSLVPKLGRRVLPAGLALQDDPTRTVHAGLPLIGSYHVDSEGVPAQRVMLVEYGILKRLLTSRTPRLAGERSNGHGRGSLAGPIRGAVGNLILTSRRGLSDEQLRAQLHQAAQDDGLPYALVVRLLDDVRTTGPDEAGGMTALGAMLGSGGISLPRPLVVVKRHANGREEFVRGLVFEPQRVRVLEHIVAAGTRPAVDSFFAPAGPLAAFASLMPRQAQAYTAFSSSVVAPALLMEELELKKAGGNSPRPPLFPPP